MAAIFFEPEAAGLPEIIRRFSDAEMGLIVVSDADTYAARSSAIALARQSPEDWEIRPKFDAMLYAVIQPATQPAGEKASHD